MIAALMFVMSLLDGIVDAPKRSQVSLCCSVSQSLQSIGHQIEIYGLMMSKPKPTPEPFSPPFSRSACATVRRWTRRPVTG